MKKYISLFILVTSFIFSICYASEKQSSNGSLDGNEYRVMVLNLTSPKNNEHFSYQYCLGGDNDNVKFAQTTEGCSDLTDSNCDDVICSNFKQHNNTYDPSVQQSTLIFTGDSEQEPGLWIHPNGSTDELCRFDTIGTQTAQAGGNMECRMKVHGQNIVIQIIDKSNFSNNSQSN